MDYTVVPFNRCIFMVGTLDRYTAAIKSNYSKVTYDGGGPFSP
jgi:hypothetical protein